MRLPGGARPTSGSPDTRRRQGGGRQRHGGRRPAAGAGPGTEFHRLWGGDATAHFPDAARRRRTAYFPPVGGFRFGLFTVPPDGEPPVPDDITCRRIRRVRGDAARPRRPHGAGRTRHAHDVDDRLRGRARRGGRLELDDGVEVHLRPATPSSRTAPATPGATTATSRRGSPCSSSAPITRHRARG